MYTDRYTITMNSFYLILETNNIYNHTEGSYMAKSCFWRKLVRYLQEKEG